MSSKMNLYGRKFGKLTPIARVKRLTGSKKRFVWECQCDCGNKLEVKQEDLLHGKVVDCGNCFVPHNVVESPKEEKVEAVIKKKKKKPAVIKKDLHHKKKGASDADSKNS